MNADKRTISIPIDGSRVCDDCRIAFHGDVCPGCGTEQCATLSAALYPIDSRKAWAMGVPNVPDRPHDWAEEAKGGPSLGRAWGGK